MTGLFRVSLFGAAIAMATLAGTAWAGPPFLTDDPDPVPYQHFEFYVFGTRDTGPLTRTNSGPAVEFNYGVRPNAQLHLIVPEEEVSANGQSARALGDTELGLKYRLATEQPNRPEIGVFPLLEVPTGDASQGLGNGRAWGKIPLWLEKNWGHYTTYGGGGYAFNPAAGARNYPFAGWLLQRNLSDRLSLGGEIFAQGAQTQAATPGTGSATFWNLGGTYNFTADFSLLFSAGHTLSGDRQDIAYLALYRTWGPGSK